MSFRFPNLKKHPPNQPLNPIISLAMINNKYIVLQHVLCIGMNSWTTYMLFQSPYTVLCSRPEKPSVRRNQQGKTASVSQTGSLWHPHSMPPFLHTSWHVLIFQSSGGLWDGGGSSNPLVDWWIPIQSSQWRCSPKMLVFPSTPIQSEDAIVLGNHHPCLAALLYFPFPGRYFLSYYTSVSSNHGSGSTRCAASPFQLAPRSFQCTSCSMHKKWCD